ncbi:helix-turn-helix domain-containing protein [Actinoallomurus soli]|uniref:helix-turn-helix domain-containing protein n=1 Tax=Actinoallomurus soli TaxID=2952535 RepID=UPI0020929B13|nr:helix-turn-helix transcriptional regulator [Actinoallomurus soli]
MSSLWDVIALQLRFQRERAGLTGTQLGDRIGCVRSTVSRIESNTLKLDSKQAALADEALKTGGLFAALMFHALREPDGQWRKEHRDIEATASTIRVFEAIVVPGLLQTPEYALALAVAGGVAEDVARAAIEERLSRQAILTREDPPLLWVILAETVLEWPVGGAEVMLKQLERLLEFADMPNIGIRVVPRAVGAYKGLDGSFKVLSNASGDVAYLESPGQGRLVYSFGARPYLDRYERIGLKALNDEQSKVLIRKKMELYR